MTINTKEFREEGMKKLGIANLRPQQEAPMEAILNNEDVIVLMPTSGGKSLLYQLPAVMEPGSLTLVISPLKALQFDQVESLRSKGIRAAVLNSDLSAAEHRDVLEDMTEHGGLLYLAPEQLRSPAVAEALQSCPSSPVSRWTRRTSCRRPKMTSARPTARSAASLTRSPFTRRSLR